MLATEGLTQQIIGLASKRIATPGAPSSSRSTRSSKESTARRLVDGLRRLVV